MRGMRRRWFNFYGRFNFYGWFNFYRWYNFYGRFTNF